MKLFLCLLVIAIVGRQTEALKCYVCDHTTINGELASGDPSCSTATPAEKFVVDCAQNGDLKTACMKVSTEGAANNVKVTSTARTCAAVTEVPPKCTTVEAGGGKTTTCYCDADKCDPKDGGSGGAGGGGEGEGGNNGSITLLFSLPVTVMLTLFAYLSPQTIGM